MTFEIHRGIDDDAPVYSIGVIAELLNISVQLLRLYETEGLIIPFKKDSKHRLYSQNDFIRLQCIRDSITNKKFSISSIKTLYSMIPCWAIKKCSEAEQKVCPAYQNSMEPCWTIKHEDNICSNEDCRVCDVYKKHNRCEHIKESIKQQIKLKY